MSGDWVWVGLDLRQRQEEEEEEKEEEETLGRRFQGLRTYLHYYFVEPEVG